MGTTESIIAHDPSQIHGSEDIRHRASTKTRPRPPPTTASTLHGIVIGLPSSGKRSLLRRLEGRDPFRTHQNVGEDNSVTVPYVAPGKTWGEKLQLEVEIPFNFDKQPDFCVVLVNPQHDPKNLKPYLLKLLSMFIESNCSSPISICVLINFRDQQDDLPRRVCLEDVQTWIEEARRQFLNRDIEVPLIETGVTSMKDCYGLTTLHHFIYQSFLARKKTILEQQLREVREEQAKSRRSAPDQSYEDFLQFLKGPSGKQRRTPRKEPPPSDPTAEHPVAPEEPNRPVAAKPYRPMAATAMTSQIHERRSLGLVPMQSADAKKALEDFFASDDDEEDKHVMTASESSRRFDDDEDDFFYDEGGHRVGSPVARGGERKFVIANLGNRKPAPVCSEDNDIKIGQVRPSRKKPPPPSSSSEETTSENRRPAVMLPNMPKLSDKKEDELQPGAPILSKNPKVISVSRASDAAEQGTLPDFPSSSKLKVSESLQVEDNVNDRWDDEDDINFDDEDSPTETVTTNIAESQRNVLRNTAKPIQSRQDGRGNNLDLDDTKARTSESDGAAPEKGPETNGWSDDDDLDLDADKIPELSTGADDGDDGEDDDFVIGAQIEETNGSAQNQQHEIDKEKTTPDLSITSSNAGESSPAGLSRAALEAIWAAQEEAQRMLAVNSDVVHGEEKTKKQKKKEKDGKPLKSKKKDKST